MTKIFERTFKRSTIQPNVAGSFQISADWLTWGDYVDIQIGAGDSGSGNKWSAWLQVVPLDGDLSGRELDLDKVKARSSEDGASNFTIDVRMAEPNMRIVGVPLPFVFHRGSNDVLGAIGIGEYAAKDLDDAVTLARAYISYLNAMFVFLFQVPLKYRLMHIMRVDNAAEYAIRTYMPWPEGMPLGNLGFEMPAGVASRLLLTYAQGVVSNSKVNRFLCFFKIVDHVFRLGGAKGHGANGPELTAEIGGFFTMTHRG